MRRHSDPRIGDLAHGILILLRAKFQSFNAFGSSYQSPSKSMKLDVEKTPIQACLILPLQVGTRSHQR